MVVVKADEFLMGSKRDEGRADERPLNVISPTIDARKIQTSSALLFPLNRNSVQRGRREATHCAFDVASTTRTSFIPKLCWKHIEK